MEIEFQLKREEYEEFIKATHARIFRISKANSKIFTINVLVWVFFGFGFTGIVHFYQQYEHLDFAHLNITFGAWLIGLLGFIGANIFQQKLFLKYSISKNGRTLKSQTVCISEQGLKYQTKNCQQSYAWSAIQGFEESENLYCFYLDNNQALLVPKRSVSKIDQSEEFLKYANIANNSKQ